MPIMDTCDVTIDVICLIYDKKKVKQIKRILWMFFFSKMLNKVIFFCLFLHVKGLYSSDQ